MSWRPASRSIPDPSAHHRACWGIFAASASDLGRVLAPMLTYTLLAGLLFGFYFTLIGIGLNLVFGVMRIVNLAHGDFLMLGAFVAVGVVTVIGIDPLFAVPDRKSTRL